MVPPLRTPYRQDAARTGTAGLEEHASHRASRSDLTYSTVGGLLRHFADGRRKRRAQGTHRHVTADSRPIYLHNRDGNLENARNYFLTDYCIASEQYPTLTNWAKRT